MTTRDALPIPCTLGVAFVCFLSAPLFAQEPEKPAEKPVEKAKESPFVIAPLVTSSPGFGSGLGVMSMFFYRPDADDKVSPNSSLGAVGAYSDTDSYFFGLFNKLYLDEDRWRVDGGVVGARIRSDLTVEGVDNIKFDTGLVGVFAKAQKRVGTSDWFVGGTANFFSKQYTSRNAEGDAYFAAFNVKDEDEGSVGAVATLDTRNHQRYPSAGVLAEASVALHPEWLGTSEGYEVLQLSGNWYHEMFTDHVLALRTYGRFTPAGTPYAGLSKLGMRSDLRGYTPGELVAENLIDTQAEWRWMFAPRFGVVGISNLDADVIYWSGGFGLRYTLNVENQLNFRIDYAWGENDDEGFYISMGEAF
jgi:outer membrane protein assembly factor BamA